MLTLPADCSSAILRFSSLFSKRVWSHAHTLLLGAILAPAQRTVTAALRVMGLDAERRFANFHRVLNRAIWSPLDAARLLLAQVVDRFVPDGTLLLVLDDTLERRRGSSIRAKGIYRDPVRSSHSHFVKASGLRWLCVTVIVQMPSAARRWALPVLTMLAPSERSTTQQGRRHKKLTDWARGALLQLRRWLPDRSIVCVADSSYAALEFLDGVRRDVTMITRLRLDAALFATAPTYQGLGRPRLKGAARPKLATLVENRRRGWQSIELKRWYQQNNRCVEVLSSTAVWYHSGKPVVPIRWVLVRDPQGAFPAQAFLSTDLALSAQAILEFYVDRWQIEVTFEEARQHLGLESQRQWSDRAIARTTPILFGLYTLVAEIASDLHESHGISTRCSAWYVKEHMTFSDALAAVRLTLWRRLSSQMSCPETDMEKVPRIIYERLLHTLSYGS